MYSNAHVWMQTFDCCYTVGIHRNEMVANEAADECCMGRHFDYDLSNDYTQSFRDKCWLQQFNQVQTAEGPAETRAYISDLDDSLRKVLHDKHKVGQSNQSSLYFHQWDKVQPSRVKPLPNLRLPPPL